MSKDIKNIIDSIEGQEKESARAQAKIDRLTEIVEKQKNVIADQSAVIDLQKQKIDSMYDVPEDVIELKTLIGEQRAEISEKSIQLELANATVAEVQKEMELLKEQFKPLQEMMEVKSETVGDLKTTIAEIDTKFRFKTEEINNLKIRIQELETVEKNIREGYEEQIKTIREKASTEKMELKDKVKSLESKILEDKLTTKESISAKETAQKLHEDMVKKYDDLITKYDKRDQENKEMQEEVKRLTNQITELTDFKNKNIEVIEFFNRLQPLFEEEPLFKAFVIVRQIKHISLSDLKNALGIPTVTIQKYVEKLIAANIFEYNDLGEVVLKMDFLEE